MPEYSFIALLSTAAELVLSEALPHAFPTALPELLARTFSLLAQQPGGLHVGRALVVGILKETDDTQQDRLGRLHGAPALARGLVAVLVLLRGVQDADAQLAARVDVGVERDGGLEGQLGRHKRVGRRESEVGAEVASCKIQKSVNCCCRGEKQSNITKKGEQAGERIAGAGAGALVGGGQGKSHTTIVLAIVVDHEHHLPLKDVAVLHQAAGNGRNVVVALHRLELSPQQRTGRCGITRGTRHGCRVFSAGLRVEIRLRVSQW